MTVLLDGDLETSINRARSRNTLACDLDEGRFEAENVAFYKRVQARFREVAARETRRVFMVNARHSVAKVHEEIVAHLDWRLRREQESVRSFRQGIRC
jgi:dTMP kinase